MKSVKDFRTTESFDSGDVIKRATKLAPNKKNGKERHALYSSLEDDDVVDDYYQKRESVLDYLDDDEEER